MTNDGGFAQLPAGAWRDDVTKDIASPIPALPWHHFPGTIVYPTGNGAIALPFMMLLAAIIAVLGITHHVHRSPGPLFVQIALAGAVACVVVIIQVKRAARASCLEMRTDAIVRYTLYGSTMLPYTDITGCTLEQVQSDYTVELLTRHGVGMAFFVTAAQMADDQFSRWLGAIPQREKMQPVRRTLVHWLLAGCALAFPLRQAIIGGHDMWLARASTHWPTTDGIVTASAALPGSRACHPALDFHYVYTVEPHQYAGSNYQFGGVCWEDARAVAAANPVGAHIAVLYRPRDPAQSVVHAGASSFSAVLSVAVLGILLLIVGAKWYRSRRPAQSI